MRALKPPRVAASFLLFCLACNPAQSSAAEAGVAAAEPAQRNTLVVRVTLNTEDKGDLFVEPALGGDFLIKVQDLKAIGFRDPPGTIVMTGGEPFISLRSMRGVTFSFREKEIALDITAPPELLANQNFGAETGKKKRVFIPTNNSIFANYALTSTGGSSASASVDFAGEVGWRINSYLFQSNVGTVQTDFGKRKLARLTSSVTHDDREELRRTVVGDFFTPARDLSSGVNLGGLSISKVYGLNPYFNQFPGQSVSGNVALPSDLEVYLDGQRIRSERIKPGEFELRDILAYGGARNVQVVLRDAFGRVQQLDYSFYFSDQPLRRGLHEYSYNLGAFRRQYGIESNRYGPAAFALFHRYGFSDALTLGLRAEGTRELLNGGPLVTAVLGSAGVVSISAAASSIAGNQGAAAQASYNYQTNKRNFGVWIRRDAGAYATLGDPPVVTNRRAEGAVSATFYLPQQQSVGLSHSFLTTQSGFRALNASATQPFNVSQLENRRVTALSYSRPVLSGWGSLTTSLSHIKDKQNGSRNEINVGINIFFANGYTAAVNYRGDRKNDDELLQFTKSQPMGEGLGFVLTGERQRTEADGPTQRFTSTAQYNAPAAILRADLSNSRDAQGRSLSDYRVSVAGGVGYAGDAIGFGRPVTDSFGIVKVGEVPGVAVSVNRQPIGTTNDKGVVFVPTLASYSDSEVSISGEMIPIEYSLPALSRIISPSFRSGAVVDFALTKIQAFTGTLKYAAGTTAKTVDVQEITLIVDGKTQSYQTGRGGEFYLEKLAPGRYAGMARVAGKSCLFEMLIPKADGIIVELGDVICRIQ